MSVFYEADGSIVLRADHEPPRKQTIGAGTPRPEQEAIIVAFFAIDADDPPKAASVEANVRL